LELERLATLAKIWTSFGRVRTMAAKLDREIEAIETLIGEGASLAAGLGVPSASVELYRLALGQLLSRDYVLATPPERGKVDTTDFQRQLAMVSGPGTLENQRDRLRAAHNALRFVTGCAELADWLRVESPKSSCAWNDYTAIAERQREAAILLANIEKEGTTK
jgi:hypothetical protein